ncbi:MAG: DUF5054 domain-containing protein [Bacteroidaceae bacterium]
MKTNTVTKFFATLLAAGCFLVAPAQVKDVYVLFKTHLDIGFTNLSSEVERNYVENFIPRAIDVAEQLRNEGGEERYVWTTGSWLIQSFLDRADEAQRKRLCEAIERGDIVWNAMPYTVESESMNPDQFATLLNLSQQLDKKFGKQTIGAKMTDVPGHTRGVVSLLSDAGVKLLHIGVNPASTVPDVPPLCRWRDTGGKEIILMYQKDYGSDMVLPDGQTAVVIAFTGDNHGPHSAKAVKDIYASLRKKYPGAKIHASTLNDVARLLEPEREKLPVFTCEIGDTWIYGFGSSPLRMACFRAVSRLYSGWVADKKIDPASETAVRFMARLGLVAEHTWGVDVKTHLHNWDVYDVDKFNAARNKSEFVFSERSWQEITENIDSAVNLLPANLKKEAVETLASIKNPAAPTKIEPAGVELMQQNGVLTTEGALNITVGNNHVKAGVVGYRSFSQPDYQRFFDNYMTHPYGWAFQDFGKPGLDKSEARSVERNFTLAEGRVSKKQGEMKLSMSCDDMVDSRVMPGEVRSSYKVSKGGKVVDLTLTLHDMKANRLPESYWYSFYPDRVERVCVEKMGRMVDVLDVVTGGNRQMHGLDRYVDVQTPDGVWRITSLDAPLVAVGDRNLLNYSTLQPDITKGIHFCLYNNVWGTNFSQWFEGTVQFRFRLEWLGK